jgi:hypothetical protein
VRFPPYLLDDIRARIPISEVIGRRVTWDKKKTRPSRGDWWANCPFHGEHSPSFHCEDRKGRYHCFGCGASGDHFRFLVECEGMRFLEAVSELARRAGIALPENDESPEQRAERERRAAEKQAEYEARKAEQRKRQEQEDEDTREAAYRRWRERQPLSGSAGELYLRGRGIGLDLAPYNHVGFHAALPFPREGGGGIFPALICAVVGPDMRFKGIWRIYITAEGKKAPRDNVKYGLGPCAGGAIWLGKPGPRINTVEGLETGFSVLSMLREREPVAVCMSTSGLENFEPPPGVKTVLNWPDGDCDRIRRINGVERLVESPGLKASRVHVTHMKALGLKAAAQPTVKNTKDYADIWNGAREHMHV